MNIIWQQPDGFLAVTTIIGGDLPEQHAEELKARGDVPADWEAVGFNYQGEWPSWPQEDWAFMAGMVVVDFARAKETTKHRLRAERAPLLQALDVAFQRALETGSDTTPIVAEKNRLRAITLLVDGCKNLTELAALSVEN